MSNKQQTTTPSVQPTRKPYVAPRLELYGAVGELTKATFYQFGGSDNGIYTSVA